MIHCRQSLIWAADLKPALTKPCKSLRRRHFMHEVQIDIQDSRSIRLFSNNMSFPNFVKESFWHGLLRRYTGKQENIYTSDAPNTCLLVYLYTCLLTSSQHHAVIVIGMQGF